MSVVGLQHSEKIASSVDRKIKSSLTLQKKELKSEIEKIQLLLEDRKKLTEWRNNPADAERIQSILNRISETEKLYLEAGDSRAAQLFKARTKRQLESRLTNLKLNELEVKVRAEQFRLQSQRTILGGMNNIQTEGRLREMYAQARGSGGFLSNFGKGFMQDLVTLETKAAGSKTLGAYMSNLFTSYEKELRNVFVSGIVRGDNYKTMISNLQRGTDITAKKAELLVVTEANAIFNESVREAIGDNPLVKGYRFRAVLDSHTSKICQQNDGNYIPKEDVQPGVNYPPLHPRCRSTVTTVLVSENEKKDTVQRYTKNRRNEWVTVPPGMTYPEFARRIEDFRNTYPDGVEPQIILRGTELSQNDARIVQRGSIRVIPNMAGSAARLDSQLGDNFSMAAQLRYDRAIAEEENITTFMTAMADKQRVKLSGIEYSAKTATSVRDKIERLKEASNTQSDEHIVDEMGDLIRYTVIAKSHDDIAATTQSFMREVGNSDYEITWVDNKYLEENDTAYKGVHLEVKSRSGQKFEVQVHSEESLEVKNRLHPLYEESRKVSTPKERKRELDEEMRKIAGTLAKPKNIEIIKSSKKHNT